MNCSASLHMNYTEINDSQKLKTFLDGLNNKKYIAVDFECEFNLHIYGEHLCLIQIFDGESFFIIDPRSKNISSEDIITFLTHPIEKVWFSASSDVSLIYNKYKIKVENVYDIQALATTLGIKGGLSILCEKLLNVEFSFGNKKKLQKTNWLIRPLSNQQIDYALSDVQYLIQLRKILEKDVKEKKLSTTARTNLDKACAVKEQKPSWTKLCQWKKLSKLQQQNIKEYFLARDVVACQYNVPAHFVLEKPTLINLGKKCPATEAELWKLVLPIKPRFDKSLRKTLLEAFNRLQKG